MSKKLLFLALCTTILAGISSTVFAGKTLDALDKEEDWDVAHLLILSKKEKLQKNQSPKYNKWDQRYQMFLQLQEEEGSKKSFSEAFSTIRNTSLFLTGMMSEEEQLEKALKLSMTTQKVEEEKREENRKIREQQNRAYEEGLLVDEVKDDIREYCKSLESQLEGVREGLKDFEKDPNFIREVRNYRFQMGKAVSVPEGIEKQRGLQEQQRILEKENEALEKFLNIKTIEGKWLHPDYKEHLEVIKDSTKENKRKVIRSFVQLLNTNREIMINESVVSTLKQKEQENYSPSLVREEVVGNISGFIPTWKSSGSKFENVDEGRKLTTDTVGSYQVRSAIPVVGASKIIVSFDLKVDLGNFGIGFLSGDQSKWLIQKPFVKGNHENATIELDPQGEEKVVLVIQNNNRDTNRKPIVSEGIFSKFQIFMEKKKD